MLKFNDYLKEYSCNKMKKEELIGKQHKLDKNKNGKLDADDFKKLRGEEVEQVEEGKMKELAMDLKDMSHDEFHKTYGKPKSHYDPTNFKKPVQKGHEMDRAKELAQRGMKSVKEETEIIAELSKKTLGSYVKKASNDAVQSTHDERDAHDDMDDKGAADMTRRVGNRLDGLKRAATKLAKEETEHVAEENHALAYVNATLAVMDEGKLDDLRDAQALRKATASAYDKNTKTDDNHPAIKLHKGTAYGGQNQKDDEGDEKKDDDTKEKRGRGRPQGSKSGARQKGNGHEDGGIPVHNLHLPNRNR